MTDELNVQEEIQKVYTPKTRIEMTGLRAYTTNTLCTIQVYNYLPKNRDVLGISVYVSHSGT